MSTSSSNTTWLTFQQAWHNSPWTAEELRDLAHRGICQTRLVKGELHFEPTGFYHAVREELALEGALSLREAATWYDIAYQTLVRLVESEELLGYFTDVDWYLDQEEARRIPELVPGALPLKPVTPPERPPRQEDTIQVELPLTTPLHAQKTAHAHPSETFQDMTSWLTFKEAVRSSGLTHSELYQAIRQRLITSKRHERGHLLVSHQSLEDYLPGADWCVLDDVLKGKTQKERRLYIRRLHQGELQGKKKGGIWFIPRIEVLLP